MTELIAQVCVRETQTKRAKYISIILEHVFEPHGDWGRYDRPRHSPQETVDLPMSPQLA